jgi:tetrahydromethanopterin S-methyltransferase subunit H
MQRFKTPQKIYEIGKVKVGGQPGELPTFLIGSIFWLGQKMVSDANKGVFDATAAEDIINRCQIQSDISGVPFALDIVGTTETAFEKYFDFVAAHTDAPLMLDAMSPRTRMAAARIAKQMGLQERCFYNSVYKGVKDDELANLKESGITMSIVLADDPHDTTLAGRMNVVEEALALAEKGGITKPLVDTSMPSFQPDMGSSVVAFPMMKEKYGHPVGTGSGNVVTTMGWVKANIAKEYRKGTVTATNAILQVMGANWLMFGPAEQAEWVFPATAVVDTYIASAAADFETQPVDVESHPIFKMFA